MANQPTLDDLFTRRLETRDVQRSSVGRCELRKQEPNALVLRTTSKLWRSPRWRNGSVDLAAFLPRDGAEGTLRVDVVSDGVLRVRYAEGGTVPSGETPMVAAPLPPPTRVDVEEGP